MRIAVYADIFLRPTETFIYETTTGLAAAGHTVAVFTGQSLDAAEHPFEPVCEVSPPARWHPVRVARRLLRPVLGQPDGGVNTAIHRRRLQRAIGRWRPDIILANYGFGGVLMHPIARHLGVPLVTSYHGVDASRYLRDPQWQARYRRLFADAAAITGPSKYVRDRLIEAGASPDRTHVLHYAIQTDRIRYSPPGERFDGGPIRLLFVGRLTPKKNPIALLRSYAAARRELGELATSLTMVGDGLLRQEVETERARLGLVENVALPGRLTHNEVIEAYRSAHLYVQHSVTAPDGDEEGLPVSITEALASGLPVVATRHSGIPEVVRDGVTGYLVDEGDVEGMGQAIARLAREPASWDVFGAAARHLLEDEFSVPIVRERLQLLLKNALSASRRAD